jgi:6-methylsalicylate decarboxylase
MLMARDRVMVGMTRVLQIGRTRGCCVSPAGSDRRDFLRLVGAIGAAVAIAPSGVLAAADRIDVHSHIAPPEWIRRLTPEGIILPPLANWSVAAYLEELDRAGIARAITSITSPGLWFDDRATARGLARACNDYAAQLRSDHPGRFGIFAVLPLPDVESSLNELEYAFDTLKADGVMLFTSYGDKWLGDPAFDPVFAELDRRGAIVYTHPIAANCCRNLVPGLNDATIEFGTDTTRAIARFVFSGSAARYPNLKMIFSHAGGTMPFLIGRFDLWSRTPPNPEIVPSGFRSHARRFYYDIAQATDEVTLTALKSVVPTTQILFGSDYPFRTCVEHVEGLHGSGVFTAAELAAIERDNSIAIGL